MAGIEPASERFDPRTSTSLVILRSYPAPGDSQTDLGPAAWTRKPSFIRTVTPSDSILTLLRLFDLRSGSGADRRHL